MKLIVQSPTLSELILIQLAWSSLILKGSLGQRVTSMSLVKPCLSPSCTTLTDKEVYNVTTTVNNTGVTSSWTTYVTISTRAAGPSVWVSICAPDFANSQCHVNGVTVCCSRSVVSNMYEILIQSQAETALSEGRMRLEWMNNAFTDKREEFLDFPKILDFTPTTGSSTPATVNNSDSSESAPEDTDTDDGDQCPPRCVAGIISGCCCLLILVIGGCVAYKNRKKIKERCCGQQGNPTKNKNNQISGNAEAGSNSPVTSETNTVPGSGGDSNRIETFPVLSRQSNGGLDKTKGISENSNEISEEKVRKKKRSKKDKAHDNFYKTETGADLLVEGAAGECGDRKQTDFGSVLHGKTKRRELPPLRGQHTTKLSSDLTMSSTRPTSIETTTRPLPKIKYMS